MNIFVIIFIRKKILHGIVYFSPYFSTVTGATITCTMLSQFIYLLTYFYNSLQIMSLSNIVAFANETVCASGP